MSKGDFPKLNAGRLAMALRQAPRSLYAVVDGGFYDDLPWLLRTEHLFFRPLYLEAADPDGLASGPCLVNLEDPRHLTPLLDLLGDTPSAAFWSWPKNEDSLYRHLRMLNVVEIPRALNGGPDRRPWESVLFRHADPNVLAILLPLLHATQINRFMGAASVVLFHAAERGGLHEVPSIDSNSLPQRGPLRIEEQQWALLEKAVMEPVKSRLMAFLCEHLPKGANLTIAQIKNWVERSLVTGREIGLRNESSFARWAFLIAITDGKIADAHEVRALFRRPGGDPDTDVRKLMRESSGTLRMMDRP